MARFSPLAMLVTAFYFLVWATQASTPLHSDVTIRMVEVLPQVYPMLTISAPAPIQSQPILTISAPAPIPSQFVGFDHCDKPRAYETWTARVVVSVSHVRSYMNVGNLVGPYLARVGRYMYQVADMFGRPTPDGVSLPTTGKLAAPPLEWAQVESVSVSVVPPPPPPPPPTFTLPVCLPPTPTSGPLNPPTPTAGHSRPRFAEPVDFTFGYLCLKIAELVVDTDSSDWLQQVMLIVSSLVLTAMAFVSSLMMVLNSVGCVEHQDTENGSIAFGCDTVSPVVPLATESSTTRASQKSSVGPSVGDQQSLLGKKLETLTTASRELSDKTSTQTLDLVIWRSPSPVPNYSMLTSSPLMASASLYQLGVVPRQPLNLNNILDHIQTIQPISRITLLIEGHPTRSDVSSMYAKEKRLSDVATESAPTLLVEWHPRPRIDDPSTLSATELVPSVASCLTAEQSYTPITCHLPRAWASTPPPAQTVPTHPDRTTSSGRSSIQWPAQPRLSQRPDDKVITTEPEPPASTSVSNIQNTSPPTPTAPLRIPPSFHRYANVRLEDLDGHSPAEKDEILRREVRVAEDRYRHEKPRRDRARFSLKLSRFERGQKGEQPPVRRKCQEEIEETKEMERVMRARQLGKEEVFEGVGGPPPPRPEWMQRWLDMVKRDVAKYTVKNEKKVKGILKVGGVKGKKSKAVRWTDEIGRRLAR
ncbi:unnamed protein product [Rhizoctonia solani]|uniref:Uncharacterized protein n=1 Tax=Rhizoctonia solani TaxID=456999 RepID=A0A8H3E3F9_9AGAM|nr:unnamed protein product [Rhizoctonia solani]